MGIFDYKHTNSKNINKRSAEEPSTIKEKVIKNKIKKEQNEEELERLRVEVNNGFVEKISKNKMEGVNPIFNPDLIKQVKIFQNFIQDRIPGYPPYLEKNEDGTYDISYRAFIDSREYLKLESNISSEELTDRNIISNNNLYYDPGYVINQDGYIKQFGEIVFNPGRPSEHNIDIIDFENEEIILNTDKIKIKISFDTLADPKKIIDVFLNNNPSMNRVEKEKYKQSKIKIDMNGEELINILNIKDYSKKIAKILTSPKNNPEQSEPGQSHNISYCSFSTINFLYLTFLLIIGGGRKSDPELSDEEQQEAGTAPLAPSLYGEYKTNIGGAGGAIQPGFGNSVEAGDQKLGAKDGSSLSNGCKTRYYATGHWLMYSDEMPVGMESSLIQWLYDKLHPFFDLINWNKGQFININFIFKMIFPPSDWCITGGFEKSIINIQMWVSKEINKMMCQPKKKEIKNPTNDFELKSESDEEIYKTDKDSMETNNSDIGNMYAGSNNEAGKTSDEGTYGATFSKKLYDRGARNKINNFSGIQDVRGVFKFPHRPLSDYENNIIMNQGALINSKEPKIEVWETATKYDLENLRINEDTFVLYDNEIYSYKLIEKDKGLGLDDIYKQRPEGFSLTTDIQVSPSIKKEYFNYDIYWFKFQKKPKEIIKIKNDLKIINNEGKLANIKNGQIFKVGKENEYKKVYIYTKENGITKIKSSAEITNNKSTNYYESFIPGEISGWDKKKHIIKEIEQENSQEKYKKKYEQDLITESGVYIVNNKTFNIKRKGFYYGQQKYQEPDSKQYYKNKTKRIIFSTVDSSDTTKKLNSPNEKINFQIYQGKNESKSLSFNTGGIYYDNLGFNRIIRKSDPLLKKEKVFLLNYEKSKFWQSIKEGGVLPEEKQYLPTDVLEPLSPGEILFNSDRKVYYKVNEDVTKLEKTEYFDPSGCPVTETGLYEYLKKEKGVSLLPKEKIIIQNEEGTFLKEYVSNMKFKTQALDYEAKTLIKIGEELRLLVDGIKYPLKEGTVLKDETTGKLYIIEKKPNGKIKMVETTAEDIEKIRQAINRD